MSGCNHEKCLRDGCTRCCYCHCELKPKPDWWRTSDAAGLAIEPPRPEAPNDHTTKILSDEQVAKMRKPAKDAGAREEFQFARKIDEERPLSVQYLELLAAYEKLERENAFLKRATLIDDLTQARKELAELKNVDIPEGQGYIEELELKLTQERTRAAALKIDLDLAIGYLREAKAMWAPNTTNSWVDELLAKYPVKK